MDNIGKGNGSGYDRPEVTIKRFATSKSFEIPEFGTYQLLPYMTEDSDFGEFNNLADFFMPDMRSLWRNIWPGSHKRVEDFCREFSSTSKFPILSNCVNDNKNPVFKLYDNGELIKHS